MVNNSNKDRKDKVLPVRMSAEDKRLLKAIAKSIGEPLAVAVRISIREKAERLNIK